MKIRTYRELSKIENFKDRYFYLRLGGVVGEITFGYDRYINQNLYKSGKWLQARDEVIIRDDGCDLGVIGYEIGSRIIVHHMNPITMADIEMERDHIFDPELLISTSLNTHNAIHYGDESLLPSGFIVRKRNDTCPWL